MIDAVRSLVRPAVTFLLIGAFIYAALAGNTEAVKVLAGPALGVLGFWFGERKAMREENGQ